MKSIIPFPIILLSFLSIIACDSKQEVTESVQENKTEEQNIVISKLFSEAIKSDSLGDYSNSVRLYSEILSIDNNFTGALINRATAFINLGDTTSGFNDLNRAVIYAPHAKTYYSRGTAYVFLKTHLDIAQSDLLNAIVLDPDFSGSYYSMSLLELEKKQPDSSAYYLKIADQMGYNPAMSAQIKSELLRVSQHLKSMNK